MHECHVSLWSLGGRLLLFCQAPVAVGWRQQAVCSCVCSVSDLGEGEFRTAACLCNRALSESSLLCQMMEIVITLWSSFSVLSHMSVWKGRGRNQIIPACKQFSNISPLRSDDGLTPGWSYSLKCSYDTKKEKTWHLHRCAWKLKDTKPNVMYYCYEYGDLNHLQCTGD